MNPSILSPRILLLSLLFFSIACQTVKQRQIPSISKLNQKSQLSQKLLSEKKYKEARKLAQEILNVRPFHLEAKRIVALSNLALNRLKKAKISYQALVEQDYKNPEYWLDLGITRLLLEDSIGGFTSLKHVLELTSIDFEFDPKANYCFYSPFFYNLAVLTAQLKQTKSCENYIRKTLELQPNYQPAYELLLRVYLTRKKNSEVLELLKLWKENPNFQNFSFMAFQYYLKNKKFQMASKCLLLALKKTPKNPKLLLPLGYTLFQIKGMNSLAIEVLEKTNQIQPNHIETLKLLAMAYLKEGLQSPTMYFKSYQTFKALLLQKQDSPLFYFYYGLACHKIGKLEEAQMSYKKAIALDENFNAPENNLWALYMEGHISKRLLLKMEQQSNLSSLKLANLAKAYENLGFSRVSQDIFQKAQKKSEKNPILEENISQFRKGN